MAGAERADMLDEFGEAREHRLDAIENGLVAADQKVELAVMGVFGGARHRRVEIVATLGFHRFAHANGRFRQCCRAVDHHRTRFQCGNHTVLAGQDGFHLRRAGHAEDNHIALGGEFRGRCASGAAEFEDFVYGLVAGMVEEGEFELAASQNIARDAVAHETDADNTNLHILLLNAWLLRADRSKSRLSLADQSNR